MEEMGIALALHVLAAVFWVGGMAFAWMVLRPSAVEVLDGFSRQKLWYSVFSRFFPMVLLALIVVLASGYYLLFLAHGGFAAAGIHIHIMHATGLVMVLVYLIIVLGPWRRFRRAVDQGDTELGGQYLARIRRLVAFNLVLGIVTVAIGAGGQYWSFGF